jgi:Zn-dependent protease|tara:strand:- start:82135 stop:83271 length:1137 start_codon:yes stop_codon:yes gene_type:complete
MAGNGYQIDGWAGAIGYSLYLVCGFACVVLHELGHSLVARHYGIPTLRIWLLPIGGMAELAEMPRRPRTEFLITIAGPLVNFAIVLTIGALFIINNAKGLLLLNPLAIDNAVQSYSVLGFASVLYLWNIGMGFFNLLPIFPMDGGRILRSVLNHFTKDYLKSTRWTLWVGKPIFFVLILGAAYQDNWFLALLLLFVMFLGELEWRFVRRRERYVDLAIGNFTARTFHCYPRATTIAEAIDIIQFHQPPEIVLSKGGEVAGIFTSAEVQRLAVLHPLDRPLAGLLPVPSALQMTWSLSMLGQQLESRIPRSYPVYHREDLIGVFRSGDIDRLMDVHRLRLRRSQDTIATGELIPALDQGTPLETRTQITRTKEFPSPQS